MLLSNTARYAINTLEEREVFTLFRRRHGLRQEEVAARVGMEQPQVSLWERGATRLDEDVVGSLWDAAFELAGGGMGDSGAA